MASELRFVFDTNTVVSALLLRESVSRKAFDQASFVGSLLVSLDTISELTEVLGRQKFRKYVTDQERDQFLAAYVHDAMLVEPTETIRVCRDPKDDQFLELAIAGEATSIISGDRDLLVLNPFREIAIITPAEFLLQSI